MSQTNISFFLFFYYILFMCVQQNIRILSFSVDYYTGFFYVKLKCMKHLSFHLKTLEAKLDFIISIYNCTDRQTDRLQMYRNQIYWSIQ